MILAKTPTLIELVSCAETLVEVSWISLNISVEIIDTKLSGSGTLAPAAPPAWDCGVSFILRLVFFLIGVVFETGALRFLEIFPVGVEDELEEVFDVAGALEDELEDEGSGTLKSVSVGAIEGAGAPRGTIIGALESASSRRGSSIGRVGAGSLKSAAMAWVL